MPPIQPAWLAVSLQSSVISGRTAANVAIGARLAIKPNVSTAMVVVPLPLGRRIRAIPPPSRVESARTRRVPNTGSPRTVGRSELGLNGTAKPGDCDKSEQAGCQGKDDAAAIAGGEIDSDAGNERSEQRREARGREKHAEHRADVLKAEIFDQHTGNRGDAAAIGDAE